MDKVSLQEYAKMRGTTAQYLLKVLCLQKKDKKPYYLIGVEKFEKFGKSWMLTVDKRKIKKD